MVTVTSPPCEEEGFLVVCRGKRGIQRKLQPENENSTGEEGLGLEGRRTSAGEHKLPPEHHHTNHSA